MNEDLNNIDFKTVEEAKSFLEKALKEDRLTGVIRRPNDFTGKVQVQTLKEIVEEEGLDTVAKMLYEHGKQISPVSLDFNPNSKDFNKTLEELANMDEDVRNVIFKRLIDDIENVDYESKEKMLKALASLFPDNMNPLVLATKDMYALMTKFAIDTGLIEFGTYTGLMSSLLMYIESLAITSSDLRYIESQESLNELVNEAKKGITIDESINKTVLVVTLINILTDKLFEIIPQTKEDIEKEIIDFERLCDFLDIDKEFIKTPDRFGLNELYKRPNERKESNDNYDNLESIKRKIKGE